MSRNEREELELDNDQLQMITDFMKAHPEVDRATALKFNLGRKFVPERVEECYQNYQKTVLEHHFEKVTPIDILDELRTQKMYIPGTRDRNGAALFVINAGRHVPGQFPPEQTLKLAFYLGELLTNNIKTARIGVTIISNMEGMEWSNFDNQFQRNIINFFQSNIPARVKNIILYKSPWWISMLVRMVSPFLKQKMRERIHICNQGDLLQFADADQLPADLGGTLEYDHENFIKREMAKVPTSMVMGTSGLKTESAESTTESDSKIKATSDEKPLTPPPGTVMLVSDELAEELRQERARVLASLDEKIRQHEENLKAYSMPMDISKVLRSRSTRLSLDLSVLPSLEPNLLHMRAMRVEGTTDQPSLLYKSASSTVSTEQVNNSPAPSPLAERPDEDYDPDNLKQHMRKRILSDRQSFLKKKRRHAAITGVTSVYEYETTPSHET